MALERERGKAQTKRCVVGEDHDAYDWALVKGADRDDAFGYQPMCRNHHNQYDWSEDRAMKLSSRMRGNSLRKGVVVTEETRQRISKKALERAALKREGK